MTNDALAIQVERRIYLIRWEKVMLSLHLAELCGVETKALNRAVKRIRSRFPPDFMFQLSLAEWNSLKYQIGTSKVGSIGSDQRKVSQIVIPQRGGIRRALPYAFTEQGVAMLSSVLRSPHAVQINTAIMRTFVRLRELLLSNAEMARKLNALEKKYDPQFKIVFDAIRELMTPPETPRRRIGFHP